MRIPNLCRCEQNCECENCRTTYFDIDKIESNTTEDFGEK